MLRTIAILAAAVMLLTGCTTPGLGIDDRMIPLSLQSKTFKFSTTSDSGYTPSAAKMHDLVRSEFDDAIQYGKTKYQSHNRTRQLFIGTLTTTGSSVSDLAGMKMEHDSATKQITLIAQLGEYDSNTNKSHINTQTAVFSYDIIELDDYIEVTITPPTEALAHIGSNILSGAGDEFLMSDEELNAYLARVLSMIRPSITYSLQHAGDVDVPYENDAVYANFMRLMGKHSYGKDEPKTFDLKKDNVFTLLQRNYRGPVKVAVYPYRDGSKVEYVFHTSHTLTPDGNDNFDQALVDSLIASVEDVARN